MGKRTFGSIRKLPSGRFQARYTGPDGRTYSGRSPEGKALTFDSRQYAGKYLERVSADIQRGTWVSPEEQRRDVAPADLPEVFGTYAEAWLAGRDLSPSTSRLYRVTLDNQILPVFGHVYVPEITPAMVREWHAKLRTQTGPTQRAHAYALLRTILGTAVQDDILAANPCRIRGAGSATRPSASSRPWYRRCRPGTGRWCCWPRGARCGSGSWLSCAAPTST